jgi:hypothetical protein
LVFDRCCIVDMGHLLGGDYTMSVKNGVARTDTAILQSGMKRKRSPLRLRFMLFYWRLAR